MEQHGQAVLFEKGVGRHHAGVVDGERLDVGVQFDAVQAERRQVFQVAPHILAGGVQRAEPRQHIGVPGHRGGDKVVDGAHLPRRGGDRLNDEPVDAVVPFARQEGGHKPVAVGGQIIKAFNAADRPRGDLLGIDVAVRVDHKIALVRHAVTTLPAFSSPNSFTASSRILYLRILPAAFMGNASIKRT